MESGRKDGEAFNMWGNRFDPASLRERERERERECEGQTQMPAPFAFAPLFFTRWR